MKNNDYEDVNTIQLTDLANIFNVYEDGNLGNFQLSYSINRTFNIIGLDNINRKYYDNYIIKELDTWLSISYQIYNTTRLWWLVCKMNNVTDPTQSPVVGDQIKLLKKTYIDNILETIENE